MVCEVPRNTERRRAPYSSAKTIEVLEKSEAFAITLHRPVADPEHILFVLLQDKAIISVLENLQINPLATKKYLKDSAALRDVDQRLTSKMGFLSDRSELTMYSAMRLARDQNSETIEPIHLLIAIGSLKDGSNAYEALKQAGLTESKIALLDGIEKAKNKLRETKESILKSTDELFATAEISNENREKLLKQFSLHLIQSI